MQPRALLFLSHTCEISLANLQLLQKRIVLDVSNQRGKCADYSRHKDCDRQERVRIAQVGLEYHRNGNRRIEKANRKFAVPLADNRNATTLDDHQSDYQSEKLLKDKRQHKPTKIKGLCCFLCAYPKKSKIFLNKVLKFIIKCSIIKYNDKNDRGLI